MQERKNSSNRLALTRIFDAPVRAVWNAWADPEQAACWWGPRGFTITTHSRDMRPGGTWVYTMHGPDGVDYPNFTRYLEVEDCARLVYDHGASDESTPPMFRVTVTFEEAGDRTTMRLAMEFATPEAAENTRKFIRNAGGDATWDRLAEYVTKQASGREKFVINRSFDAPAERLFDMWTDPAHFSRWLPPTGQDMEIVRGEIQAGSTVLWKMFGSGRAFFGCIEYIVMDKPNRIVYTQQFCDEHGNPGGHPYVPNWPQTMLTTVEFVAEGPDRSRVTLTWEPGGKVKDAVLAAFVAARAGMTMGWTGSFDKLEAALGDAG